jgi:hypothetical protein
MVSIIGQIKPGGSGKTRTTRFMKRMGRVLSSSRELINLGNVGVCQEMICDIDKGSVNCSSGTCCHIRNHGYTGRDAWKQHCDDLKNTLEQESNAIVQGNLKFIFLSLWIQYTKSIKWKRFSFCWCILTNIPITHIKVIIYIHFQATISIKLQ